jgi:RNA-binding protein NOB1
LGNIEYFGHNHLLGSYFEEHRSILGTLELSNKHKMATETPAKSIHSLILDAGPIIKGEPSVSSLLQQCEQIICSPAVIAEIRDLATRQRVETTLKPFLVLRTPKNDSVKVISDFAKKTGDIAVLSKTDIQLLALAYEIECERNDGDWRLRKVPGQKRINGSAPAPKPKESEILAGEKAEDVTIPKQEEAVPVNETEVASSTALTSSDHQQVSEQEPVEESTENEDTTQISESISQLQILESDDAVENVDEADDGSDSEGWITPSNIKRKQLEEDKADASGATEPKVMQVVSRTSLFRSPCTDII